MICVAIICLKQEFYIEKISRMLRKILFIACLLNYSECFSMQEEDDVDVQRAIILRLFSDATSLLMSYSDEVEAVKVFTKEEINTFLKAQESHFSPACGIDESNDHSKFVLGSILAEPEVAKAILAARARIRPGQK